MKTFTPTILIKGNPNHITPEAICMACEYHFIYSTANEDVCEICINKVSNKLKR